jgi:integrase
MPKKVLNDKVVKSIPEPRKEDKPNQVDYWDADHPAFGLRVSYKGARTWIVAIRINGGPVRRKIGRYPAMSLAQARTKAQEVQEAARNGIDPNELARAERRKKQAEQLVTFAAVRAEFVVEYRNKEDEELRTMAEYERALKAPDFREWENRPISSITPDDVEDLLGKMKKAGTKTKANRTLSYLQTLFKWARKEKKIAGPLPTDGVERPAPNKKRERSLNVQDLRIVWQAINEAGGKFAPLFKLLLLTAVRKEEAAGMEWREFFDIDGIEPIWDIPSERMKMDRRHRVHLPAAAVELLKALPREHKLVFTTTGTTPFSGESRVKARVDKRVAELCHAEKIPNREHWQWHDFRRTFKTHLKEMGIPEEITKLCMHHKRQGVDAAYDWSELPIERRAAMDVWAAYLTGITERPLADGELAQLQRKMRREYHQRIRGED